MKARVEGRGLGVREQRKWIREAVRAASRYRGVYAQDEIQRRTIRHKKPGCAGDKEPFSTCTQGRTEAIGIRAQGTYIEMVQQPAMRLRVERKQKQRALPRIFNGAMLCEARSVKLCRELKRLSRRRARAGGAEEMRYGRC
ncbi:hypothetical protein QAD02_019992 [Eretmocerus hayati]|uniref:Uncharacterized protein n=1 Tax=Eretmocerus hayati TaxID=131215 RepID=A0ACC2PLB1_9HYME|nr:hypothetical protein QAD02_019992 [Eretmocerus hayati]